MSCNCHCHEEDFCDEDPTYPDGACWACHKTLDTEGLCMNDECEHFECDPFEGPVTHFDEQKWERQQMGITS
jgi:hypothetical protein